MTTRILPRPRPALVLLGLAALATAMGCAEGEDRTCEVNADCASGLCQPDGTCAPVEGEDAGTPPTDGHVPELDGGSPGVDAGERDGAVPLDDGGLPGCVPNRDGVIERSEVPLMAGLRATFKVASDVTVSTAGEDIGGGRRRWDLSSGLSGDHDVLVETLDPAGAWWADDHPAATYATRLADSTDLLGVFEIDATTLSLIGVVSPDDGLSRTNLEYDPAVTTLAFPLEVGDSWTTDATVSGLASGIASFYYEDYENHVDAEGELITPFGTFDVLRVRVVLTRTVGALVTVIRSYAFVSECFGTVATVTSRDNESRGEFTRAAEVRRLTP